MIVSMIVIVVILTKVCWWLFGETVRLKHIFYLKEEIKPIIMSESEDLLVRRTYIKEITKLIKRNQASMISIGDSLQFDCTYSISVEELAYLQELRRDLMRLPLPDEKRDATPQVNEKETDWGDF